MIWFTGCTHFGHANIIRHCRRPFSNSHTMDCALIAAINEAVQPGDTLYHLGDVAWTKGVLAWFVASIRVRDLRVIPGNHDRPQWLLEHCLRVMVLPSVCAIGGKDGMTRIVLCHYPLLTWPGIGRGAIHLYSHSHGRLHHPHPAAVDVSVDAWGYNPVSLDEVLVEVERGRAAKEGGA